MILYSQWMQIPITTRTLLAEKFGISRVGVIHVQDNRVVADGYKIEDVERALNIEALKSFVGVDHTDLSTLLQLAVTKIETPEPVAPVIVPEHAAPEVSPEIIEAVRAELEKRMKPAVKTNKKKNAKKAKV